MGTINIHTVIHTIHEDITKATQAFINSVEKLGHEVVSTVITDDNGQVSLTPVETVVKEVATVAEKDTGKILHSTLDAL